MGRRGNRNKKKRTGRGHPSHLRPAISKKKFKKEFCRSCGICIVGYKPSFCYRFLYYQDPEHFEKVTFPSMIAWKEELKGLRGNKPYNTIDAYATFTTVFCGSGICESVYRCGQRNKDVDLCLKAFIEQTQGNLNKNKSKFKQTKPKADPTMMVIISDNSAFEEEVLSILDNYNQQHDQVGAPG